MRSRLVDDRCERPCPYVEQLIGQRLAEVDERMRDLVVLKRDLGELQRRMAADEAAPAASKFCHFIETAAGAGTGRSSLRASGR